jgi:hypothetical protein
MATAVNANGEMMLVKYRTLGFQNSGCGNERLTIRLNTSSTSTVSNGHRGDFTSLLILSENGVNMALEHLLSTECEGCHNSAITTTIPSIWGRSM